MNIRWSAAAQRFECEFQEFAGDLAAVKAAKFKTDGPPGWCWWTQSIKALNAIRKDRPASGLTITPEALAVYTPLAEQEAKNSEVRTQLAIAKKVLKKSLVKQELETHPTLPEGVAWIGKEHLPSVAPWIPEPRLPPPPPPDLLCVICAQPVYLSLIHI